MELRFETRPAVTNEALNELFTAAWVGHEPRDFTRVLACSLGYVCAYHGSRLVGFVNVAWDGGDHAFLLDPTVHPDHRRRGTGTALVSRAALLAREAGVEWLHVDHEPHLEEFYRRCGFRPTLAGLMNLRPPAG